MIGYSQLNTFLILKKHFFCFIFQNRLNFNQEAHEKLINVTVKMPSHLKLHKLEI